MRNTWVTKGTAHERFISVVFTDPALLATAMLLTTRFLLGRPGKSLGPKVIYHTLQFRGFVIQQITSALSDAKRASSDALITAVLLLSAYELSYGDVKSFHVHMKGLIQMIKLRGGLQEIAREDPYTEGFIRWHDVNAATLAGCQPYFLSVEGQSNRRALEPDPTMFRMRERE